LSNLAENVRLRALAALGKQRWIIERDYQELKQELGLGHFEGRGWRGFHHHATLSIAAYGFLPAERCRFSPSARSGHLGLSTAQLPPGFRPRGAHPAPAAHPHSIATLRIILARSLLRQLCQCPFCGVQRS
jgi:hypothetical protein